MTKEIQMRIDKMKENWEQTSKTGCKEDKLVDEKTEKEKWV